MGKQPEAAADRPHPRESYGHPRAAGIRLAYSDHKPGHDTSRPPARAAASKDPNAVLPPHDAKRAPKTPLAERVRQGLPADKGYER